MSMTLMPGSNFLVNLNAIWILTLQTGNEEFVIVCKHLLRKQPCDGKICTAIAGRMNWVEDFVYTRSRRWIRTKLGPYFMRLRILHFQSPFSVNYASTKYRRSWISLVMCHYGHTSTRTTKDILSVLKNTSVMTEIQTHTSRTLPPGLEFNALNHLAMTP